MKHSFIIGTGSFLPNDPITNDELSDYFELDPWILDNVGVQSRFWSVDLNDDLQMKYTGYEMATIAARRAIEDAQIATSDIDSIFLVTAQSDYIMPNSVVYVQDLLEIKECKTYEIHAACSGALQAVDLANNEILLGKSKNVLVCCFNLMSPTIFCEIEMNKEPSVSDMLNLSMFGDGASAIVISANSNGSLIEDVKTNSVGLGEKPGMELLGGGAVFPMSQKNLDKGFSKWKHDSNMILEKGTELSRKAVLDMTKLTNRHLDDYDFIIFPQANPNTLKNDIKDLRKNFGVESDKIFYTVDKTGNTSTSGLFIALDQLKKSNKVNIGDKVLIIGGEASKWMYGGLSIVW